MNNKLLFLIIVFFNSIPSFSQNNTFKIQFIPYYNNKPLIIESNWYATPKLEDSITIDVLKFYIGNIALKGNKNFNNNKYYLVNIASNSTLTISFDTIQNQSIKNIEFTVGVDSNTTAKGILNESLDPLHGMYWTWNTGYINAKIEGKCKNCKSFRNAFQLHIGGYKHPFNTIKKIDLAIPLSIQKKSIIKIKVDIDRWLQNIDFNDQVSTMQPNEKAMKIANNFTNSFSIISNE